MKDRSARSEPTHRRVQSNGINVHIAEAGQGPLVALLHGFPELWYSWRHQLPAIAEAGYHAVAPDLRGYGQTNAPEAVENYSMKDMAADIIGLLDALGHETAVFVGHDWGANIAWACAELYPERVAALAALSVPYHPRTPAPPVASMKQAAPGTFNFAVYFQEPGVAEAEFEADTRRSLRLFFYALSGDAPPDLVPFLFTGKLEGVGALDGVPEPQVLPGWLTESDLEYYAQEFSRTGFRGALNRYRNIDRDWRDLPSLGTVGVKQPALFIGGERDPAFRFGNLDAMRAAVPNLRDAVILPGCGHWVQQEYAGEVNAQLIDFLHEERVRS